jgi:hypothetical protein
MDNTFTYEQFLELLNSSDINNELIKTKLLNYKGTDVRLLGAKSFAEKEQDITKLKTFLEFNPLIQNKSTNKNKFQSQVYYKIAASVLLILGLSIGVTYLFKPKNYYELYAVKDTGLNLFMGESATNIDDLMTQYKDGDFEKAKTTSLNLIVQQPTNDTLHYYLGVINCELNLPNQAIQEFDLVSQKSVILYEKAFFTKALCLMTIDKAKAKDSFIEITKNTNNTYYKQASLILNKEY